MTKNGKEKTSPISFVLCAILVLYTVVFLMLLLWALITAVKSNDDFVLRSNFFWLPKDATTRALLLPWEWEWENFAKIIKYFEVKGIYRNGVEIAVPFITQVIYTLLYAGGCSLLQALCPCIVAYATSKFSYRFNRVIELVVLFTMIIPIVGSSMSMIDFLYAMNLYDTFLCLYVQKFYFANMNASIISRQRGFVNSFSESFSGFFAFICSAKWPLGKNLPIFDFSMGKTEKTDNYQNKK